MTKTKWVFNHEAIETKSKSLSILSALVLGVASFLSTSALAGPYGEEGTICTDLGTTRFNATDDVLEFCMKRNNSGRGRWIPLSTTKIYEAGSAEDARAELFVEVGTQLTSCPSGSVTVAADNGNYGRHGEDRQRAVLCFKVYSAYS